MFLSVYIIVVLYGITIVQFPVSITMMHEFEFTLLKIAIFLFSEFPSVHTCILLIRSNA